jgi:hypothetical protein
VLAGAGCVKEGSSSFLKKEAKDFYWFVSAKVVAAVGIIPAALSSVTKTTGFHPPGPPDLRAAGVKNAARHKNPCAAQRF